MPRSVFMRDVDALAADAGQADLASVQSVRFDNDSDEVYVSFTCADGAAVSVCILCADIDDYPDARAYFMNTADSAPSTSHTWAVDEVQRAVQDAGQHCTLRQLVDKLIHQFSLLDKPDIICLDSDDDDGDDGDHDEDGLFNVEVEETSFSSNGPGSKSQFLLEIERRERISQDLKAVCDAGYFFGVIDGMTGSDNNNIVAVSVKIATLGLGLQMLLAWDLDPEAYVVLLIRFSAGYIAYERLLTMSNKEAGLSFRIGKCTRYKPSVLHAHSAFGADSLLGQPAAGVLADVNEAAFSKILISGELGRLMSDSFLTLLRIQTTQGMSWTDTLRAMATQARPGPSTDTKQASGRVTSLPLLAMQFAVDRIRNYTKYCQSCFAPLEKGWQSFKPSVCSRELCLFQHIQMGLTQYLEYEILCQPAVIDLLVNFCYVALAASIGERQASSAIRTFPSGLRLIVPDEDNRHACCIRHIDTERFAVAFPESTSADHFKQGHWVAVSYTCESATTSASGQPAFTFTSTPTMYTTITPVWPPTLGRPLSSRAPVRSTTTLEHAVITEVDADSSVLYLKSSTPVNERPTQGFILPYTKDLDEVRDEDKASLLMGLLDTVPSVDTLRSQLQSPLVSSLKDVDGLSPSAAMLLEWIIATNRSCIMQLTAPHLMALEATPVNGQMKYLAPPGWLQFCFLHGSPDHETQFAAELDRCKSAGMIDNDLYPTLFAWHGSNIKNWHSILRTGLDYQVTTHGRSYGNGVYFSHDFNLSLTYAQSMGVQQWPQAVTDLASVLSLNELINAPQHFTSQTPHYVVQHKNWNCCRFLFAQAHGNVPDSWPRTQHTATLSSADWGYVQQPLARPVYGPQGGTLHVPLAAMPSRASEAATEDSSSVAVLQPSRSRWDEVAQTMSAQDLAFIQTVRPQREVYVIDDDTDDLEITKVVCKAPNANRDDNKNNKAHMAPIVISDDEDEPPSKRAKLAAAHHGRPAPQQVQHINKDVTPFVPGTLDHASLRVLQPPSWGTPTALRVLASSMRNLQRVQATTPPPNLGWHIDFDRLENLFQWVVELHSFDNRIPLAADMRRLNVNAIVMEMRFGPDYPHSPPLVRVIRPRFLQLMQGGGGHVTAGGSMCMELLTSTGWSPDYDLAAVLMQVHMTLTVAEPPARLESGRVRSRADYGIEEAIQGYMRSAATHGWTVPRDMAMRGRF